PAEPHDDGGCGHCHGPWHGPHESPTPLTSPLMALAVGAIVAGFVGIPAAIGGGNAIEKFLEPSFTAQEAPGSVRLQADQAARVAESAENAEPHVSRNIEIGLVGLSLLVAISGILLARKFYVTSAELSEDLAEKWDVAHRVLLNNHY